jgi:hypothetical protein
MKNIHYRPRRPLRLPDKRPELVEASRRQTSIRGDGCKINLACLLDIPIILSTGFSDSTDEEEAGAIGQASF